jgi:hypothetical protein
MNFDGSESPNDYFYELKSELNAYSNLFLGDDSVVAIIAEALCDIEDAINTLDRPGFNFGNDDHYTAKGNTKIENRSERSIFEDVDV